MQRRKSRFGLLFWVGVAFAALLLVFLGMYRSSGIEPLSGTIDKPEVTTNASGPSIEVLPHTRPDNLVPGEPDPGVPFWLQEGGQ